MLAKTIEVHIHANQFPGQLLGIVAGKALSAFSEAPSRHPTAQAAETPDSPPAIGCAWPEAGGIYVGIARGEDGQPDAHLILTDLKYQEHTWAKAMQAAKELEHAGHNDWRVPTKNESALLYANVADKVETGDWYWTSTEYSNGCAWLQNFYDGRQRSDDADYEGRVRFVRSISL